MSSVKTATNWIPPNVKEILAEWWEQYAQRKGLTWETGPPVNKDQHGNLYVTLHWAGPVGETELVSWFFGTFQELLDSFEESMTQFLGDNKHVIWRISPQFVEGRGPSNRRGSAGAVYLWGSIRARLTCYPEKPPSVAGS